MQNIIILVGIAFFIVSLIGIQFFFKKSVADPVRALLGGVKEVASGNLKYRVPLSSHDEIGLLASSFNRMTEDLQGITVSRDALVSEMNERRKTEEELKVAYGKLKDTQLQLVQSAKMASVGQLASGVAHEINNPLTGVLNNVQLMSLMAAKNTEFNMCDFKEFLGIIEESALRCKKITQALLDFSHASKAQLQAVSLNDSADRVVVLISHEINLNNITIRKELDPKLPKIKADPQLLEQVILDLVVNSKWAIQKKGLPEGGSITIKTRHDKETNQAVIEVIDTGIGIPEENMEKIFEPFFTTKEVGEGTGLGLSLVYGIVTNLNGTIKVESQWGKGATFRLGFPILS
jgi:two-component system NtrC family sensor kinase